MTKTYTVNANGYEQIRKYIDMHYHEKHEINAYELPLGNLGLEVVRSEFNKNKYGRGEFQMDGYWTKTGEPIICRLSDDCFDQV